MKINVDMPANMRNKGASQRRDERKGLQMTDLIKTYSKIGVAKTVAKKTGRDDHAIVVKGDLVAIVQSPKIRSHRIDTPRPLTARAYTWALCNELLAEGLDYKALRATALMRGVAQGYHRPQLQTEISRWRHRFN